MVLCGALWCFVMISQTGLVKKSPNPLPPLLIFDFFDKQVKQGKPYYNKNV